MTCVQDKATLTPAESVPPQLAHALRRIHYDAMQNVSPNHRPWTSLPREWLRHHIYPDIPPVLADSCYARRQQKFAAHRYPAAYLLHEMFIQSRSVPIARAEALLSPELRKYLHHAALITETDAYEVHANYRLIPLDGQFFVADLRHQPTQEQRAMHVQFGQDTVLLARVLQREAQSGLRALDLCTGSGALAVTMASRFSEVHGVDINQRAIHMAKNNATLNSVANSTFVAGDLYAPTVGRYDLICANPPFVYMPENGNAQSLAGNGGGMYGAEITVRILEGLEATLSDRGQAFLITQGLTLAHTTQCQLIKTACDRLGQTSLSVEFRELSRVYDPTLATFYAAQGVRHCTSYMVRVRRAKRFQWRGVRNHTASALTVKCAIALTKPSRPTFAQKLNA